MIYHKEIYEEPNVNFEEFSSQNGLVTKQELYNKLKSNHFFSI